MRPPWRWVGGKTSLAAQVEPLIPGGWQLWVEPFCGGLGSFLSFAAGCPAVLADGNAHLVDGLIGLRDSPEQVIAEAESLIRAHSGEGQGDDELQAAWRRMKAEAFSRPGDQVYAAAWLYVGQQIAINGLYRTNQGGGLNAAHGKTGKALSRPRLNPDHLRGVSGALQQARIYHLVQREGPGQTLTERLGPLPAPRPGVIYYFDPPYLDTFSLYGPQFALKEHQALAALAVELGEAGASVVVHNSPGADPLYHQSQWRRHTVVRSGRMNCTSGDGSAKAREGKEERVYVYRRGCPLVDGAKK